MYINKMTTEVTWMISLMLCFVVFFSKYWRISAETFNHLRAYSDRVSISENVPFACLHNRQAQIHQLPEHVNFHLPEPVKQVS